MMTKRELKSKVERRRQELAAQREELENLRGRIAAFVGDIRSRSVIYNLVRNLTVWKELEKLLGINDDDTFS